MNLEFNKANSILDSKLDNRIEKSRNKFNENNISFKETLEKVEKDIKVNNEKTSKIDEMKKNVEFIESKLESLTENGEIASEDKLEIKNFLKDLKQLLDLINSGKVKNSKIIDSENLIFSIEQLISFLLNLIEKADFKSLKDFVKSTQPIISRLKESIDKPILYPEQTESKTRSFNELINQREDKQLKNSSEKLNINFENIKPVKTEKNESSEKTEVQINVDNKSVSFNKREIDILKDFALISDKKLEKPVENIVVKNYNPFTSTLNRVNLEALISQITGKAVIIVREGKSELRMQLFPPELGKMNMKFSLEDGQLTGKIVVSTKEAFMLFDQNKESLAQSLNQAGVNIGRIDIALGEFDSSGEKKFEEMQEKTFTFGKVDGLEKDLSEEIEALTTSLYDGIINYVV